MRILFLLAALLMCFILLAQDPSGSSLDLGDVIIEGESDLIKDSLGTNYDLDSLLKVNEADKFLYKPDPVLEEASEQAAFMSNRILTLEALGGNFTFASLQAALSLHPLLSFNFHFQNRSLEKNWNDLELGGNWIGCYKELQFNVGGEYLQYDSELTDTEAKDVILGIERISSREDGILDLPEFKLSGSYYTISQDKNEIDGYDVRSRLNWKQAWLEIDANLDYLKEHLQGDLTLYANNLPVNRLGLYLHYRPEFEGEKGKIMVSVDFYNRIILYRSLFLNLSNSPSLTSNSYMDDLKLDHYHANLENSNQISTLIAPEFSLEYFGPLYVKGSFKYTINKDHYHYIPDSTKLYKMVTYGEMQHQEFQLTTTYEYKFLKVGNVLTYNLFEVRDRVRDDEYTLYARNVPYTPELINTTFIEFSVSNWKLLIENKYQQGREDEFGEDMTDYDLLNASVSYTLLTNLEILVEVENIFDEKYNRSTYLPEEGIQFKAGFRWSY